LIVLPDERIILYMMNATENMMSNKDLTVSSTELTAEQKAFLEAHEEMHRQFGRLPRPARVAQDVVINDKLMNARLTVDASGSMNSIIGEDTSGSMAGVSKLDWAALMRKALTPQPYSAKSNQMIMITDGETQQSSFPKPKYEKFKSNEAMIEEKLLTGRNRRSNKEIAAVRQVARKLNRKLKVQLEQRMKNVKSMQTVHVIEDRSACIPQQLMKDFLQEVALFKNSVQDNTED
jgi:hypothetical protein